MNLQLKFTCHMVYSQLHIDYQIRIFIIKICPFTWLYIKVLNIPIYKIWNAIIWRIFDPYTVHHQSLRIQLSDKRGPILPIDIFSRSKLCVTARCNNWWPRRKSLWPFLWFSRAVLVYKLLATSNSETLHLKRW